MLDTARIDFVASSMLRLEMVWSCLLCVGNVFAQHYISLAALGACCDPLTKVCHRGKSVIVLLLYNPSIYPVFFCTSARKWLALLFCRIMPGSCSLLRLLSLCAMSARADKSISGGLCSKLRYGCCHLGSCRAHIYNCPDVRVSASTGKG